MLHFSYNASPILKQRLEKIDLLRSTILAHIISPKTELKIRFEKTIEKIFGAFTLSNIKVSKQEISKVLLNPSVKKRDSNNQINKLVLSYKNGLDYVSSQWLCEQTEVESQDIAKLSSLVFGKSFRLPETDTKRLLLYLKSQPEHPVIQSGIVFIQTLKNDPEDVKMKLLAHLLSLLFLYNNGYNVRGFLAIEEFWIKNSTEFGQMVQNTINSTNITLWLEYFAQTIQSNLYTIQKDLHEQKENTLFPTSFTYLNDRQKEILTLLDQPDSTFTNKKVQRMFGVSQITASRDLAKLATLGLLFPHGKGRSVHYSR